MSLSCQDFTRFYVFGGYGSKMDIFIGWVFLYRPVARLPT